MYYFGACMLEKDRPDVRFDVAERVSLLLHARYDVGELVSCLLALGSSGFLVGGRERLHIGLHVARVAVASMDYELYMNVFPIEGLLMLCAACQKYC